MTKYSSCQLKGTSVFYRTSPTPRYLGLDKAGFTSLFTVTSSKLCQAVHVPPCIKRPTHIKGPATLPGHGGYAYFVKYTLHGVECLTQLLTETSVKICQAKHVSPCIQRPTYIMVPATLPARGGYAYLKNVPPTGWSG